MAQKTYQGLHQDSEAATTNNGTIVLWYQHHPTKPTLHKDHPTLPPIGPTSGPTTEVPIGQRVGPTLGKPPCPPPGPDPLTGLP
jgi:hypothetical protein